MIALAGLCLLPCGAASGGNQEAVAKISSILDKGDAAYVRDDMESAVKAYGDARKEAVAAKLPERFKSSLDERYAQAAAQAALAHARKGERDTAMVLIEEAFKVFPKAPGVKEAKAQLEEGVRFNPAASDQHAKKVEDVSALLRKAYGSYDLGDFDQADSLFDQVLRIDAYNVAARRGKEKVAGEKSRYYKAAYDEARAKHLADVSAQWEIPVPPMLGDAVDNSNAAAPSPGTAGLDAADKLSKLIVGNVDLESVGIMEALDFVRNQARRLDVGSAKENQGINIVADLGPADTPAVKSILDRRFNVKMRNVPLSEVLRYIADMTGTQLRNTPFAIRLVASGQDSGSLVSRVYKVSPDFFAGGGGGAAESDPFGSSSTGAMTVRRANPKTFFENSGVKFPSGAMASYNAHNSTLIVRNTMSNLDLIEDIISARATMAPSQVIVKATFVQVSSEKLKELGFDWIIGYTGIGNNPKRMIAGGSQGNGGDVVGNMPPPAGGKAYPNTVTTAGLRSGGDVYGGDTIESLIQSGANRSSNNSAGKRAPGILSFRAIMTNADIAVVMRGLDQCKATDMMQQPQMVAKPGDKATFAYVREFIYPTEYTEPQLPNSMGGDGNGGGGSWGGQTFPVTPSHPTGFNTKQVGVTMEVEPNISEDKTMVDLRIVPEMTEFEGFVNYGNPIMASLNDSTKESGISAVVLSENQILMPIFSKKKAETNVTIANGHTVVIGGLMKSKKVRFDDKVPVLGDIPFVGRLFRSEGEKNEEQALIIMVRADIVDPSGQSVGTLAKEEI